VLGEFDRYAPDLRVCAMAKSPAGEEPRAYQQQHACARDARLFDDHRRLLGEVRPDVVVISTRLDLIAPLAIESAARGCHLICEKPLALDHPPLWELWDACRAAGVQCQAILDNHVNPALVAARDAVRSGRLGRVAIVNARKSYKWGNRPEWFGRRSVYGGTIPWVGIHALDYIGEITARRVATVAAAHANLAHARQPECEDSAAILLTLDDGAIATASLDLLRPSAADTHGDDWIRVVGSTGVLETNLTRGTCTLTTESSPAQDLPIPPRERAFVPLLTAVADGSVAREPAEEMRRAFQLTHLSLRARDAADLGSIQLAGPTPADGVEPCGQRKLSRGR
jgi:predicted dehydrogenase